MPVIVYSFNHGAQISFDALCCSQPYQVLEDTRQTSQEALCFCMTTAGRRGHIIIVACTVCLYRTFPQRRLILASLQQLLPLALRVSFGTQAQLLLHCFCVISSPCLLPCHGETLLICQKIKYCKHVEAAVVKNI